jgi:hypothetical protein
LYIDLKHNLCRIVTAKAPASFLNWNRFRLAEHIPTVWHYRVTGGDCYHGPIIENAAIQVKAIHLMLWHSVAHQ